MRLLLGEYQQSGNEPLLRKLRAYFETDLAAGTTTLRSMITTRAYALLVLALDMPARERVETVREYRYLAPKTLMFVVSDMPSVHERVSILEAGVDDCLSRPYHTDELVAKIRALARRVEAIPSPAISAGALQLNQDDGRVSVDGRPLDLQLAEQRLLALMMMRPGRLVTKDRLEGTLGDDSGLTANAIEQRVSRLRKILQHARANVQIRTVRGSGYVLEPTAAAPPILPDAPPPPRSYLSAAE